MSRFHAWLVRTQIAPAFAEHAFVQRALVLLVPQLWRLRGRAGTTPLMIAYSKEQGIDLEAIVDAVRTGAADPNLPLGVTSFDLHRPIDHAAFVQCTPAYFAEWERSPECGCYEGWDGFAVYARFARDEAGAAACVHVDAKLGEEIDFAM